MNIHFLGKGEASRVSGGNLYNRYVLSFLESAGLSIVRHEDPRDLATLPQGEGIIVDSIALPDIVFQLRDYPVRPVLLLHVVPHEKTSMVLQPASDLASTREVIRRSLVVVTGAASLELLRELMPGEALDVVCVEPGVPGDWGAKAEYRAQVESMLCVANYEQFKGQQRLLDALEHLPDPNWKLELYGEAVASAFNALAQRIENHPRRDQIKLSGAIPHSEVHKRMLDSDLLIHLSDYESYSTIVAEAIATGLPVLASRTGNYAVFRESGMVRYLDDLDPCKVSMELARLINDPDAYSRLRPRPGWSVRNWDDVGREFLAALEQHRWT